MTMNYKIALMSAAAIALISMASPASADEFGQRFSQQAPAGLTDTSDSDAAAMQNIEPAAGDETPAAPEAAPATAAETDPEASADEQDGDAATDAPSDTPVTTTGMPTPPAATATQDGVTPQAGAITESNPVPLDAKNPSVAGEDDPAAPKQTDTTQPENTQEY